MIILGQQLFEVSSFSNLILDKQKTWKNQRPGAITKENAGNLKSKRDTSSLDIFHVKSLVSTRFTCIFYSKWLKDWVFSLSSEGVGRDSNK